jgi:catechol 2,3-dioxygenase-like lactoylglutathione lyase family enzyme
MAVRRLNHAVLYVHGLERTVEFYRETLGFEVRMEDWAAETAEGAMTLPLDLDTAIARWGTDQVTGAAAGSPT